MNVRGPAYRELFQNQDIILRSSQSDAKGDSLGSDLEQVVSSLKPGDVLTSLVYTMGNPGTTRVVSLTIQ